MKIKHNLVFAYFLGFWSGIVFMILIKIAWGEYVSY